jgi:hypothetical protein
MQRSQFRTHLHRVIIWARMTDTRVLLDPGERHPAARFSAARVMRAMVTSPRVDPPRRSVAH